MTDDKNKKDEQLRKEDNQTVLEMSGRGKKRRFIGQTVVTTKARKKSPNKRKDS